MLTLRQRLVVLPVLVLIAGMIIFALFEGHDARERVLKETDSGMEIARALATRAITHAGRAQTAEEGLENLSADLPPTLRHVRLEIERGEHVTHSQASAGEAPGWFMSLAGANPAVEHYPIVVAGQNVGAIVLTSDPADEVDEVWEDWKAEMTIISLIALNIIVIVVWAVNASLRPLTALTQAFDRLESGDYSVRAPRSADPQLRKLGERFNRLVESLEQAMADNRLLINRLMSVQEAERKDVARELHDEYGPSLFAIRADVGAISRWAKKREPKMEELQERLTSISQLVTQIQRINSRLLERLRPLAVGQMRLHEALNGLITDWRTRYPDLSWEGDFQPVGNLADEAEHALYRAAQECMTNIVRHAEASQVRASLSHHNGSVVLVVEDDGVGVEQGKAHGFGLLGMAERARAVGGRVSLSRSKAGGVRVEVVTPCAAGGEA